MKSILRILQCFLLLTVVMAIATSCEEDYDPYKNPRPPERESKRRQRSESIEPSFELPFSGCSRREPQSPPSGGGGGGGGGGCSRRSGSGCSRRENTPRVERHVRPSRRRPVEDPNAPIYPCPDHIFPFCTDENPYGVDYKSGTYGVAGWPSQFNLGCLSWAPCPVWYYMQIDQPGDLLIYIEQRGKFRKLLDVDFVCWGPFEADSKREFLEMICNYQYQLNISNHESHRPANGDHRGNTGGYPFGNLVDCSFSKEGTEWCFIPEAKTGDWYLLLLTNYKRKKGTIHFERVDNMSTATTNCNVVIPITLNPSPKGLTQIDSRTSAICLYETKALVVIDLEMDDDYRLPKHSLSRAHAEVFANGRTYQARLKNGHFECEIDIETDTTEYFATVYCPDPEFNLDTEPHYIVKTTDCSPEDVEFTPVDPYHAGDVSFVDLVRGDVEVEVDFTDPIGIIRSIPGAEEPGFDPRIYDVTVEYDDVTFQRVEPKNENGIIILKPKMRGDWCDCFVSDTMTFKIRMIPNNGDVHATPYEIPIQIGVLHQTVWIGRCLWALIAIGVLLLFIIYLRLMLRKRRFKKGAMMNPVHYERFGEEKQGAGQTLRLQGFGHWFARWFLPGAERSTLSFSNPRVSAITFVAAESGQEVELPKKSIHKETMQVDGYDPENDPHPKEPVRLGSNAGVTISRKGVNLGRICYSHGDKNDGGAYRLLLGILMVASFVAIVGFAFFMIRALF